MLGGVKVLTEDDGSGFLCWWVGVNGIETWGGLCRVGISAVFLSQGDVRL